MTEGHSYLLAGDLKRMDIGQEGERRYWTEKWGISLEDLQRAVDKAGPMVDDVAKELGRAN